MCLLSVPVVHLAGFRCCSEWVNVCVQGPVAHLQCRTAVSAAAAAAAAVTVQTHRPFAFRHICSPWLLHHENLATPEGFCCGRPRLCGHFTPEHQLLMKLQECWLLLLLRPNTYILLYIFAFCWKAALAFWYLSDPAHTNTTASSHHCFHTAASKHFSAVSVCGWIQRFDFRSLLNMTLKSVTLIVSVCVPPLIVMAVDSAAVLRSPQGAASFLYTSILFHTDNWSRSWIETPTRTWATTLSTCCQWSREGWWTWPSWQVRAPFSEESGTLHPFFLNNWTHLQRIDDLWKVNYIHIVEFASCFSALWVTFSEFFWIWSVGSRVYVLIADQPCRYSISICYAFRHVHITR